MLPRGVARSLCAIAALPGDNCRRLALETVRVAAVGGALPVVAQTGGLDVLLGGILDPTCKAMASALLLTLMFLLNDPERRRYVRPRFCLQHLLAPFSQELGPNEAPSPETLGEWEAASRAIITLMRSWTGLILLSADPHGIGSLVLLLHQPVHPSLLLAVVQTIGQLLHPPTHVSVPPQYMRSSTAAASEEAGATAATDPAAMVFLGTHTLYPSSSLLVDLTPCRSSLSSTEPWAGRFGTHHFSTGHDAATTDAGLAGVFPTESRANGYDTASSRSRRVSPYDVLEGYLAALLGILLQRGLAQGLAVVSTHSDRVVASVATHLLHDVVALAGRLLPEAITARHLGMAVLVQLASYPLMASRRVPRTLAGSSSLGSRLAATAIGAANNGHFATGAAGVSMELVEHANAVHSVGSPISSFPGAIGGSLLLPATDDEVPLWRRSAAATTAPPMMRQWPDRVRKEASLASGVASLLNRVYVPPQQEDGSGAATVGSASLVVHVAATGTDMGVLHDVKARSVRASAVMDALAHSSLRGTVRVCVHTSTNPTHAVRLPQPREMATTATHTPRRQSSSARACTRQRRCCQRRTAARRCLATTTSLTRHGRRWRMTTTTTSLRRRMTMTTLTAREATTPSTRRGRLKRQPQQPLCGRVPACTTAPRHAVVAEALHCQTR